jgi:hypothetical protein
MLVRQQKKSQGHLSLNIVECCRIALLVNVEKWITLKQNKNTNLCKRQQANE